MFNIVRMKRTVRSVAVCVLVLGLARLGNAQSTFHVFPQVADGGFEDGTFYRSTLMVLPGFEGDAAQCTLTLYGMTAAFPGGASGSSFPISVPAGGSVAMQTTGSQPFQGGYGTLSCNVNVFATLLYSLYISGGAKYSEATVFSSSESVKARLIADEREGARLGIAVANNTDSPQSYIVTYTGSGFNVSATLAVPARRAVAKFLDEIMSAPAGSTGVVTITSPTLSNFSVIGLRFTGGVFTTIPPS